MKTEVERRGTAADPHATRFAAGRGPSALGRRRRTSRRGRGFVALLVSSALLLAACDEAGHEHSREPAVDPQSADSKPATAPHPTETRMKIHYLEIVTPEVEETCAAQARLHGLSFGEPEAALGNARTAALPGGGTLGVRAPMHDAEDPVVRPYVLVENIEEAVADAEAAGATIALPPMELPGHGRCAIYIQGGIQHGLWEL